MKRIRKKEWNFLQKFQKIRVFANCEKKKKPKKYNGPDSY